MPLYLPDPSLPEVKTDSKGRLYFECGSLGSRVVIFPNAVRDGSGRYKGIIVCVAFDEIEQGRALRTFTDWEDFKNFYECLLKP
jgi:hypothetical protein